MFVFFLIASSSSSSSSFFFFFFFFFFFLFLFSLYFILFIYFSFIFHYSFQFSNFPVCTTYILPSSPSVCSWNTVSMWWLIWLFFCGISLFFSFFLFFFFFGGELFSGHGLFRCIYMQVIRQDLGAFGARVWRYIYIGRLSSSHILYIGKEDMVHVITCLHIHIYTRLWNWRWCDSDAWLSRPVYCLYSFYCSFLIHPSKDITWSIYHLRWS